MDTKVDLHEGIFLLKYLADGTLAVFGQDSSLRILDAKTFKTLGGFKAKLTHEHRILNIMDISYGGKFALVGVPKKHEAALFLPETKKLKWMIGKHKGEIESVAISDNEYYFATGGTDGRTFVYSHATQTPMIALPPKTDYITAIVFSEDSNIIAYGSFDRTISVKNISTMADDFILRGHTSPIKKIRFLSSQRLVSADKEGHIIVWDLHTKKILHRLPKMLDEILDITMTKDKHYLFASTPQGDIGLYDLREFICLDLHYLKVEGRVNALAVGHNEHTLFYATQEGFLSRHYLLEGEEELCEAIERKDIKEAYNICTKNIFLSFSDYYTELENAWKKALRQAQQLYGKGLGDVAVKVLTPYSEIPLKRTIVKTVHKEFEEFEKFKHYISEKKYALAYSLAAQHEMYKETQEYKALESIWEEQFTRAKKAILALSGEEQAHEHLALFRGVSHKAKQITQLFHQRQAYTLFRSKLAKKDFSAVLKLVSTHPFLQEYKEFKDLKKWADLVYIKIHKAYKEQDYLSAIKYAQLIKDFPEYKSEIISLIEHAQVYIDFKQALQANNLEKVYQLLEKNSFLADLPALEGIDKDWDKILTSIESPMNNGDIQTVLDILEPYPYKKHKMKYIMVLIKTTYLEQLEAAIIKKYPPSEIIQGMKKIYSIFGKDELFLIIVDQYKKEQNVEVDFSDVHQGLASEFSLEHLSRSIFVD